MVETFTTELLGDLINVLCMTNKQYFQTESASLWQLQKLNCIHIISYLLSFSWHWSWLRVILLPTYNPNVNLQQDHLPSGPDCHSICSKNFDSVREILNFEEKFPILTKVGFLHPRYQKFCSAPNSNTNHLWNRPIDYCFTIIFRKLIQPSNMNCGF